MEGNGVEAEGGGKPANGTVFDTGGGAGGAQSHGGDFVGRRRRRRERRDEILVELYSGSSGRWILSTSLLMTGGLLLLSVALVVLMNRYSPAPERSVQSIDALTRACRLEDSTPLSEELAASNSPPIALVTMPYAASTPVRIVLEKITGTVTAAAMCDARLKHGAGLQHECGEPRRALLTVSAAPLRNATAETVRSYSASVLVTRNPFDWIAIAHQQHRRPQSQPPADEQKSSEVAELIPHEFVESAVSAYREVFTFWYRSHDRQLVVHWEDLMPLNSTSEPQRRAWASIASFAGRPAVADSRVACALRPTIEDGAWFSLSSSIANFAGAERMSESARQLVCDSLADVISLLQYDQQPNMAVRCGATGEDERTSAAESTVPQSPSNSVDSKEEL